VANRHAVPPLRVAAADEDTQKAKRPKTNSRQVSRHVVNVATLSKMQQQ